MKSLILLSLFFLVSCAQAREKMPAGVAGFLVNADDCQHLSGEWDSSLPETQKRNIENQADIVCSKAKAEQKKLKVRYRNDKETLKIINEYDF